MEQTKKLEALKEKLEKVDADIIKTKERSNILKNKRAKLVQEIKSIELDKLQNFMASKGLSVEEAIKKLE